MVQFGLGESYSPPDIEVPTVVYAHPTLPNAFVSKGDAGSAKIHPIIKGEIVNLAAFNYFIKLLYRSALKTRPEVVNVPMVLIASSQWSKIDQERITQYVFEEIGISAFTILPAALGTIYAYGGLPTALVIDIGAEKTEIVPVVDYSVLNSAKSVIPFGGDHINETLKHLLPNLSAQQIESLKRSDIYEALSDEDKKKSFFGIDALDKDKDDEFDVAAIVTSGRTREILEEREKQDKEKTPNSQLENNTFIDESGETITVGKERFKGTEDLIQKISHGVSESLKRILDLHKRQDAWDHILVTGRTSRIVGFLEALNTQLVDDHLVGKDLHQSSAAQAAFQSTVNSNVQISQVPNSIRLGKMPEYFPEWKKIGYSDVQFLGAEIFAKQIFSSGNESMYVTQSVYAQNGPMALWDLAI